MSLFPPRPVGAIPDSDLAYYESTNLWVAQYKYNGSRNLVHVEPNGKVSVWSRHGTQHLSYSLPAAVHDEILALPGLEKGKEFWLDSELLNKTTNPHTKHKIVFFDVLQAGRYLYGRPDQMKRLELLKDICGDPQHLDPYLIGYSISPTLLLAPVFADNFLAHWNENRGDEVEGLLLRRKNGTIQNFGQKYLETGDLVRCRHAHKNYNF
jgi:hypothetical protein